MNDPPPPESQSQHPHTPQRAPGKPPQARLPAAEAKPDRSPWPRQVSVETLIAMTGAMMRPFIRPADS